MPKHLKFGRAPKLKIPKLKTLVLFIVIIVLFSFSFAALIKYSKSSNSQNNVEVGIAKTCSKFSDIEKLRCWDKQLNTSFDKNGLGGAFDTLMALYDGDPSFQPYCHSFTHELGDKTYYLFASHKDITFSPNVSYCSFGFYHGFMQAFIRHDKNISDARAFCDEAQKKLGSISRDTIGKCYHGIGHGAVDDSDVKWPSEDVMVTPALKFCETVSPSEALLERCASGVFNAMAIAYESGRLTINKSDPLWYCSALTKEYAKITCYEEMNTFLMSISNDDFQKASKYVEKINGDAFAMRAINGLASVYGQLEIENSNFKDVLFSCRSLQSRLTPQCIDGFVSGLIEAGKPNFEYVKPLEFCQDNNLSEGERIECFNGLIWQTENIYPADKEKNICDMIGSKYNSSCFKAI